MTNRFQLLADIIGCVWILYISWRIYVRSGLKGPLLFGVGLVIKIAVLRISTLQQFLIVIGDVLFWSGFTIMAALESEKARKLFTNANVSTKDVLLGNINIPQEELKSNIRPNETDRQSYLWIQALVIIILIILYFFLGIKVYEILQYIIICPVLITYHILKRRGYFAKKRI